MAGEGPISPYVAIIGGGPAGLMAAETLAAKLIPRGGSVTVFDQAPAVGRKFLMAGRGGLNLTHSEDLESFLARYGKASMLLRPATEAFPPARLRAWCEALGQTTFVGSSGRVFPTAMKASPLLRSWLIRLRSLGVAFRLRYRWTGWNGSGELVFETPDGPAAFAAHATVIALGGASWPRLGSDGKWVGVLAGAGMAVTPLRPANCGFVADWSDYFRERFQGAPLKGIELRFGEARVRGEAVITASGLEGGAVYALSARLRDAIEAAGEAILCVDLRPSISGQALEKALSAPRGKQSMSSFLRKMARLSGVEAGLLNEAVIDQKSPQRLAHMSSGALVALVKGVPVRLTATAPIARAISTAGGVALEELNEGFMIRRRPGLFAAGEMLDWEAPTGGYLLQACFATGAAAGRGALAWLEGQHGIGADLGRDGCPKVPSPTGRGTG